MTVSTRNSWRLVLLAALLAAAACSDTDRPRVPLGSTGGTHSGSSPSDGGDDSGRGATSSNGATSSDAGEASVAGQPNGAANAGGAADAAGAGAEGPGPDGMAGTGGEPIYVEPLPEPECIGTGELSGATKLAISTGSDDQFGSVTPDELTIAWTVVDGNDVTLHYAERPSASDDFGTARTLELTDSATDSVALSADGLRLVYVNADRKGFTQLVRAAIDDPFNATDSRDFVPIAESAEEFADDEYVGDPVIGPDDSTFFYSRYGAKRTATLLGTLRFSIFAPWPAGTELPVASNLKATANDRPHPTGMSLDRQTLFVWNGATSKQMVALLSHETSKYEVSFELENARGAAPNAACSRIYFDRDGDLWTAKLQ